MQDSHYVVPPLDPAAARTITLNTPTEEDAKKRRAVVVRRGEHDGPRTVQFDGRTLGVPPGGSATFEARAVLPAEGEPKPLYPVVEWRVTSR